MFTDSSSPANVATSGSTSSLILCLIMKDINSFVGHNLNQNSTIKDNLRTAWHGVELLLQKAQKATAGTPFQGPIAVVNVLIELGNVCPSFALHVTFADNCPRPLSTARTHWKNL